MSPAAASPAADALHAEHVADVPAYPEAATPPSEAPAVPDHSLLHFAASEGVQTALGGVWYLVNVLVECDMLDSAVSPWLLLDALARTLITEPPPDPLWGMLATLAEESTGTLADPAAAQQQIYLHIPTIQAWLEVRRIAWDALPAKLHQPAQLYITRTHVDLHFGIEQIDLEIRRAGLDQNPGWVPELARIVTFHFG
jgi:hypothetical protein